MVEQAEGFGLRFHPKAKAAILPAQDTPEYVAPSVTAVKHESLQGWWWIAEFLPKRIKDPTAGYEPRWIIPRGRHRHVADGAKIHAAVFDRMAGGKSYRPPNIPSTRSQVQ